jgi:hypothetical protein
MFDMACNVFANGDEVSCKAGGGKVIAAFPDVCLTPPPPPTGPLPVPYADSSFSKDMKNGSRSVKIGRKEVMLKDVSFYKTSPLGDEAATRNQGAGIITHVITGKTYFVSWSMDVLIEGKNADRHTDMTTSNHASPMANAQVPMSNVSSMSPASKEELCQCCKKSPPHSEAQKRGESISEEEFYGPQKTGLRKKTLKGGQQGLEAKSLSKQQQIDSQQATLAVDYARTVDGGKCAEQVPPKPPGDDPCNKYYKITGEESKKARRDFDAYKNSEEFPAHLRGTRERPVFSIAHRVPLSGGGCPVGPKNLSPVTDPDCDALEKLLGKYQGDVATIIRDDVL